MHTITSSDFLKRALLADAVVSATMGVLQLVAADPLAAGLNLSRPLLSGTAEFMLVYAAALLVMATRPRLWSASILVVVLGNLAWALASVALLLEGLLQPNAMGIGFVLFQAAGVCTLAGLEWLGLRRSSPANRIATNPGMAGGGRMS